MSLSATQNTDGTIFKLNHDERSEPVVSKRLEARKALTIENRPEADFATAAWKLVEKHPGARIVVFRKDFEVACKIGAILSKMDHD